MLAAAANSYGKDYPEYLKQYAAAYGEEPTGSFSALGHDGGDGHRRDQEGGEGRR